MADSGPPRPVVIPKARPKPWVNRHQEPEEDPSLDNADSQPEERPKRAVLTYGDIVTRFEVSQERLSDMYPDKEDRERRKAINNVLEEGITMACAGLNNEDDLLPPDDIKKLVKDEVAKLNEKFDAIEEGRYVSSDEESSGGMNSPEKRIKSAGKGLGASMWTNAPTSSSRKKYGGYSEAAGKEKVKAMAHDPSGSRVSPGAESYKAPKRLQSASTCKSTMSPNPTPNINITKTLLSLGEHRDLYLRHIYPSTFLFDNVESLFNNAIRRIRLDRDEKKAASHVASVDTTVQSLLVQHPNDYSAEPLPDTDSIKQKRARPVPEPLTDSEYDAKRANTADYLPLPELDPSSTTEEAFYRGVKYALKVIEDECHPVLKDELKRRLGGLPRHVKHELGLRVLPSGAETPTPAQFPAKTSGNVPAAKSSVKGPGSTTSVASSAKGHGPGPSGYTSAKSAVKGYDFGVDHGLTSSLRGDQGDRLMPPPSTTRAEDHHTIRAHSSPRSTQAPASLVDYDSDEEHDMEDAEMRRDELASMPGRPIPKGSDM